MHLEGQQSILSALKARKRDIELILISQSSHVERYQDTLAECEQQSIPVRFAPRDE